MASLRRQHAGGASRSSGISRSASRPRSERAALRRRTAAPAPAGSKAGREAQRPQRAPAALEMRRWQRDQQLQGRRAAGRRRRLGLQLHRQLPVGRARAQRLVLPREALGAQPEVAEAVGDRVARQPGEPTEGRDPEALQLVGEVVGSLHSASAPGSGARMRPPSIPTGRGPGSGGQRPQAPPAAASADERGGRPRRRREAPGRRRQPHRHLCTLRAPARRPSRPAEPRGLGFEEGLAGPLGLDLGADLLEAAHRALPGALRQLGVRRHQKQPA